VVKAKEPAHKVKRGIGISGNLTPTHSWFIWATACLAFAAAVCTCRLSRPKVHGSPGARYGGGIDGTPSPPNSVPAFDAAAPYSTRQDRDWLAASSASSKYSVSSPLLEAVPSSTVSLPSAPRSSRGISIATSHNAAGSASKYQQAPMRAGSTVTPLPCTRQEPSSVPDIPNIVHHHPPPFDNAVGRWVLRGDFPGKKSFGWFECPSCSDRAWSSAHSQTVYKQACKDCRTECFPCCLWVNDTKKAKLGGPSNPTKLKPHRADLCMACKDGMCST
jgi:hypothetical protein